MTNRVLVCGGRNFNDADTVFAALEGHVQNGDTIIQGGAPGADRLAREWCHQHKCRYENYPADWKAHGRAAGPIRNQQMIDEGKPTKVIAFPGGRGTADMVRRARAAGIPVFEFTNGKEHRSTQNMATPAARRVRRLPSHGDRGMSVDPNSREFLIYYARVMLREASSRRGQNVEWMLRGAARARRQAAACRPAQMEMFT